ncbi:M56 family metallopeptidase [Aureibaculum luteum]|uniref:M56 family metallopeptidase n=1 Tax=Aureibaculum luteum TaxID=1548456 RepID=UPI0013004E42|nr:M56 family metallopeptidase [Aureibaculum luteum]
MDYFLKANGLVILWIVFYYLFLRNETFYNSIRTYFLVGLLFILSIPLIEIPIYIEKTVSNINYILIEGSTTLNTPIEQSFDWLQIMTIIYLVGVVFFTAKFMMQLFSLSKLISRHKIFNEGNYKLVETEKDISPFSFFKYIIYNKSQFTQNELKQIITHEKTHVKQWHSIDTLLIYILQIVFWFNPFAWLYKRGAQQNLEFLADVSASRQSFNLKQYQFTLLKASNTYHYEAITNNFYNSLIKKRIVMLNKSKSKKINYLKYFLILPLLAVFLFAFNTKTVAQEKEKKQSQWVVSAGVSIDKNTSDTKLKEIKSTYNKKGVELRYKTKRNSNNEIIKIDITLKDEKGKVAWTENNNAPIKPFEIIYTPETKEKSIRAVNSLKTTTVVGYAQSNNETEPLYIVNGKESSKEVSELINPDEIKSVSVLKDKSASDKYGDKGKNGVVEIKTSKINKSDEKSKSKSEWKINSGSRIEKKTDSLSEWNVTAVRNNVAFSTPDTLYRYEKKDSMLSLDMDNSTFHPLYIIDGKESTKLEVENLDQQRIASVSVWKGDQATAQYGTKGKDGVISIITNNSKKIKPTVQLSSKALYVLNGRETTKEAIELILPDDIASVNVIKNENAITKYGDKGKNGVVEIKTKIIYRNQINIDSKNPSIIFGEEPLIIINGKESSIEMKKALNPDNIKSMNVLKDKNATEKYGDKGKNGVIEITLKKE